MLGIVTTPLIADHKVAAELVNSALGGRHQVRLEQTVNVLAFQGSVSGMAVNIRFRPLEIARALEALNPLPEEALR